MKFSLVSFTLALSCFSRNAEAYPAGPGQCLEGAASVGGIHLMAANITESTLEESGVTVVFGGTNLAEGNPDLAVGMDLQWSVTSDTKLIKGLLVVVSGKGGFDGTGVLSTSQDSLGPAAICEAPLAGIGHTAKLDTDVVVGTIRIDDPEGADVNIDVTVVFENDGGVSDYAFESYKLKFEAAADMETEAPTEAVMDGMGGGPGENRTEAPTEAGTGGMGGGPDEDDVTEAPTEAGAGGMGGGPDEDDVTEAPAVSGAGGMGGGPDEDDETEAPTEAGAGGMGGGPGANEDTTMSPGPTTSDAPSASDAPFASGSEPAGPPAPTPASFPDAPPDTSAAVMITKCLASALCFSVLSLLM